MSPCSGWLGCTASLYSISRCHRAVGGSAVLPRRTASVGVTERWGPRPAWPSMNSQRGRSPPLCPAAVRVDIALPDPSWGGGTTGWCLKRSLAALLAARRSYVGLCVESRGRPERLTSFLLHSGWDRNSLHRADWTVIL